MNPYKVLEISENATQDEIKSAYRRLIKKYHPDKYIDNPLKDLAEQKMREINEAYEMLSKNTNSSNQNYNNTYSSNNTSNQSYNNSDLNYIRNFINNNRISEAEAALSSITNHTAEWHFLYGLVMIKKGWFDSGYQNISTAVSMEPNNLEYRRILDQLNSRNQNYSNQYYRRTNDNSFDACDCCLKLYCLDSLCECVGGNLCDCC